MEDLKVLGLDGMLVRKLRPYLGLKVDPFPSLFSFFLFFFILSFLLICIINIIMISPHLFDRAKKHERLSVRRHFISVYFKSTKSTRKSNNITRSISLLLSTKIYNKSQPSKIYHVIIPSILPSPSPRILTSR